MNHSYDDEPVQDDSLGENAFGDLPLDDLAAEVQDTAALAHHTPREGAALDGEGRLISDITCNSCGYNLRGQLLRGTCSECGLAVEISTKSDRLAYADPHWVKSLKQGVFWLLVMVFTQIGAAFVSFIISLLLVRSAFSPGGAPPSSTSMPSSLALNQMIDVGLGLVVSGLMILAAWKLSQAEPGETQEAMVLPRTLLRWCTISGAGLSLTGGVLVLNLPTLGFVLSLLGAILQVTSFFALCILLRRFALRIPDSGLAGQTRIVMWGITASYGILILTMVAVIANLGFGSSSLPSNQGPTFALLGIGACMFVLGFLVFGIWGIILLFFYHDRFAKALQHSRSLRRQLSDRAAY